MHLLKGAALLGVFFISLELGVALTAKYWPSSTTTAATTTVA